MGYSRQGASLHEAEDLTQEFFRQFLVKNPLAFLLVCLKHLLAKERRRARTQKRGGGKAPTPLDTDTAELQYAAEAVKNVTPDMLHFHQLARALRAVDEFAQLARNKFIKS